MSTGDRICGLCGQYNCNGHDLSDIFTMTYPNYKIRTDYYDLDRLWRVRMALAEIGWVARCDYERAKKFNEGYDAGFSQARLGTLIGTGGDTK